MSNFGQVFGILNTIRDEYIDVFEAEELKNRFEKECLPLPVLVTFQDSTKKCELLKLLRQPLTEASMEKIVDLTMDSAETCKLTQDMKKMVQQELEQTASIEFCKDDLKLLLSASLEDL